MTYRVIIQPPASADMDAAYEYIRERSPEAAIEWYNGLLDACATLEELPTRCQLAPESRLVSAEIHQLHYGKRRNAYRILFIVREDEVRVLHVRHGAREHLKGDEIVLP
jgi:plasmid stabilization system protein ParE